MKNFCGGLATGTAMTTFLKIRDLWKSFGQFVALRDISLDVIEGEFLCFLGPSGCGKTTLLRAIAGLDIQTAGTIHQAGKDVSNLPPAERDFGIVFQSYALFPNLTISENISFGLENAGKNKAEVKKRVDELLQLIGLPEQRDKYPAQLSGGQQQRIALARAIATSPGLLLLDEPLSALDAKVRVHLRHEMTELQRKLKVTTVMVTHDQEEALSMADRIVVMNHGVIEQVGTPTEIYTDPVSLFVADFIGEMNQVPAEVTKEGEVRVGNRTLLCRTGDFAPGSKVIAALRPEDVIPHDKDVRLPGTPDVIETLQNTFDVVIKEMEFLGSFWRTSVSDEEAEGLDLTADFSINAVRRLSLAVGEKITVELPADRLKAFSETSGAEQ
jgi:iron(III) transport system ATP-binding protein